MGDFNDNPSDRSIKPVLKTLSNKKKLLDYELFNPMEALFKKDTEHISRANGIC